MRICRVAKVELAENDIWLGPRQLKWSRAKIVGREQLIGCNFTPTLKDITASTRGEIQLRTLNPQQLRVKYLTVDQSSQRI